MEFPQKIKNRTNHMIYQSDFCVHIQRKLHQSQRNTYTSMFTAALFTICKTWKQPKCPSMDEWTQKMWYIHNEIWFIHKKKEILPFATTWMDFKSIMLSEMSHTERLIVAKYLSHLFMEHGKTELIETEWISGRQRQAWEAEEVDKGNKRYKVLVIR